MPLANPLPSNLSNSNIEHSNLNPSVSIPASPTVHQETEPLRRDVDHNGTASLSSRLQDQVVQTIVANSSDAVGLLFRAANSSDSEGSDDVGDEETQHATGPRHSTAAGDMMSPSLDIHESIPTDILELWNQHRFVRQGWFTAREAVAYVHA